MKWGKIFANHVSDQGLMSKICEETHITQQQKRKEGKKERREGDKGREREERGGKRKISPIKIALLKSRQRI